MSKLKKQKKVSSTLEQEAHLWQTTFDALKDSVFIIDLNQKILQCNKATLDFFNKSSLQEIIGRSCCELMHNKSQPVEWCPMVRLMNNNQRESSTAKIGDKWIEISADPIFDDDNKLIGAVHLMTDITQNKLTELKLRESEEKYHGLFDSFPHFIGLVDMQGILIECNIAINKFLSRHTRDDLIGLNFIQILSIIDKNKNLVSKFQKLMQQTKVDGELKSFEFKIYRSKGDLLWLRIEGSEILIGGQKFIQFIIQDITTRKITEEKLRKSELKIQERVNQLGCIYKLSKLIDNPMINPEGLIHGTLEIIPPALQFTDLARIRIRYEDNEYTSIGFMVSDWKLKVTERINREELTIEVFYLENKPFLNEESDLIREIIIRLKSCFEEREAQKKLNESEERYRLISQNADENLFIFDMNLNVIYNDPNVPNILGYTNDEISKLKLTDYNEPSSLKILLKAYKEELRDERKKIGDPKRIRMFEIDQIHKDGSIVNVEVKFTFLRDEEGIAKGIISITRDISKRKQAEQRLRESEEKYRLISETAYDLIAILNKRFKYEYINESAFKQILGYSSSEILGKSSLKFIHPDDTSKIAKTLFEGFKEGQGGSELRFKHKEGHWVWIEAKGKTFLDKDGELKAIVISRDVTERKKSEEQLRDSETKYREAYNRATFYKDLFGHDMNNILTVINSSADLIPYYLGESEKSKNIRSIINILQNQVNRGAKLISNVNALSELEEQVIPIEPVNVNKYLENSIEFIKTSFKERDLKVDVEYSNGSKFKTQANQLLREVFDNVLINAIKYNDNSTVEILVKVSEEILDNGSFVKLQFIDNGIGVPDERKSMIFKRGNRELKGSKGMGIGLSLVKKILKSYKGKIWVEDKVNGDYSKGSKFVFLIPNFLNG